MLNPHRFDRRTQKCNRQSQNSATFDINALVIYLLEFAEVTKQ